MDSYSSYAWNCIPSNSCFFVRQLQQRIQHRRLIAGTKKAVLTPEEESVMKSCSDEVTYRLTEERRARLDSIGFVWNVKGDKAEVGRTTRNSYDEQWVSCQVARSLFWHFTFLMSDGIVFTLHLRMPCFKDCKNTRQNMAIVWFQSDTMNVPNSVHVSLCSVVFDWVSNRHGLAYSLLCLFGYVTGVDTQRVQFKKLAKLSSQGKSPDENIAVDHDSETHGQSNGGGFGTASANGTSSAPNKPLVGRLTDERIRRLENIGFVFSLRDDWQKVSEVKDVHILVAQTQALLTSRLLDFFSLLSIIKSTMTSSRLSRKPTGTAMCQLDMLQIVGWEFGKLHWLNCPTKTV